MLNGAFISILSAVSSGYFYKRLNFKHVYYTQDSLITLLLMMKSAME